MKRMAVLGAGTMGHGIAQVCAAANLEVRLWDVAADAVAAGVSRIGANLDKGVARGKVTDAQRASTLANVTGVVTLSEAVADVDLIIEAVPERLALKQSLLSEAAGHAPAHAVIGTNTSSLSIAEIASAVPDPGRVIGTHFFNPVHIMALLEVVVGVQTRPEVVTAAQALGAALGKQVILVQDVPGFATSRLGVCLGMEAIRMLEQGVASAEDIDAAMVLGYRHPVGPLKLTDMVGLDVRLAIGEYLADALGNEAFRPPALLRDKVARGDTGKKSGRGFYDWPTA